MCACHGFMSAELDGVQCKSYLLFETATPLGWVKVKAPYGLDASKLKKSDGTENFQNMRDRYYDFFSRKWSYNWCHSEDAKCRGSAAWATLNSYGTRKGLPDTTRWE